MSSEIACPDNLGKSRHAGKKIIIYLTMASMLNLVGCYYQQQMNPEEYKFDENLDLQVTTKDSTYWILSDDYYYANDTLYIKVLEPKSDRTILKVKMNIPRTEIAKVEATKTDITGTWIVAGVALAVATTIVIFLTNEKFEKMKKN